MKHTTLFWGSSYDRGLIHLLNMWPKIIEKFPEAELHIAYGWELFDKGYRDNPERMSWKERMNKLMQQPGITHHGRIGKKELKEVRQKCGIWAYPTHFTEINCITALEAQADGLVPVTMALGALKETVGSGYLVQGDIYDDDIHEDYLNRVLGLMESPEIVKEESEKAVKFAQNYSWEVVAKEWEKYL